MEFTARARSTAPPEQLFALLAAGDRWAQWAGPMVPRSRWEHPGEPEGGVGAVRRLGLWPFVSLERVVEHQAPHRLGYVVDSPAPYRDYRSTVTLAPRPDGGTDITWSSSFTPRLPGTGRPLRWFLGRCVRSFATHLAAQSAEPAPGPSSQQSA